MRAEETQSVMEGATVTLDQAAEAVVSAYAREKLTQEHSDVAWQYQTPTAAEKLRAAARAKRATADALDALAAVLA